MLEDNYSGGEFVPVCLVQALRTVFARLEIWGIKIKEKWYF